MKTIEQHLQELFVGKKAWIRCIKCFDENLEPEFIEAIGTVKSYEISTHELCPDAHKVTTHETGTVFYLSPLHDGLIEIIQ